MQDTMLALPNLFSKWRSAQLIRVTRVTQVTRVSNPESLTKFALFLI